MQQESPCLFLFLKDRHTKWYESESALVHTHARFDLWCHLVLLHLSLTVNQSLPGGIDPSPRLSVFSRRTFFRHTSAFSSLLSTSLHQTVIYSADLFFSLLLSSVPPSLSLFPLIRYEAAISTSDRCYIKHSFTCIHFIYWFKYVNLICLGCTRKKTKTGLLFWLILSQSHVHRTVTTIHHNPSSLCDLGSWQWRRPSGDQHGHLGKRRISSINSNLLAGDWIRCHPWKLLARRLIGAERY